MEETAGQWTFGRNNSIFAGHIVHVLATRNIDTSMKAKLCSSPLSLWTVDADFAVADTGMTIFFIVIILDSR